MWIRRVLLAHLALTSYGTYSVRALVLITNFSHFHRTICEVFPFFHRPPGPYVPTVTLTSSTIVTTTDTTSVVCVKLINVTGPCLLRRETWVEEPIVLSFNEDFDDTFDILYSPVLGQVYSIHNSLIPHFVYNFLFIDRVEPTVAPENFIVVEDARINQDVSASIAPTVHNDNEEYQRNNFPFHLFHFSHWFSSTLPSNTVIYQQTSTFTQTATVVNTVFIQRCTPSPFPFSLCHKRRM